MWVEVFRTGEQTDSNGQSKNWLAEDLDKISSKYEQRLLENPENFAPLVKGHPKNNQPAIGWVEKLARRGNFLLAKFMNISNEVSEEIRQKKFQNVSISMTKDLDLNHIGLLGAANPAVKGLKPIEFVSNFQNQFENDENSNENSIENSLEIEKKEESNESFEQSFEDLKNELREEIERFQQIKQENDELRKKISNFQRESALKEFQNFAENLVSKSKITNSGKLNLVNALEYLYSVDEETENKFSLVNQFMTFVTKLSNSVSLQEFAVQENAVSLNIQNSFEGKKLIPERADLHQKIIKMMNHNPNITYEEAANLCLEKA